MLKQRVLFLALAASSAAAIELSPDNWDAETAGKSVFIKFFAPWCGHCKALKPDWDKLMEEFSSSSTQLIADVDCTAEGEPLCGEHGIQGFPTLKWGDPSDLQEYDGGRTFEDLKAFAEENLKPMCSVENIDLCDDDKKAQIQKYVDMDDGPLGEAIAEEEKKIEDAEKLFESEVEKLQEAYEKLMKEKEDTEKAVKAAGLGLMKSVMRKRKAVEEAAKEAEKPSDGSDEEPAYDGEEL